MASGATISTDHRREKAERGSSGLAGVTGGRGARGQPARRPRPLLRRSARRARPPVARSARLDGSGTFVGGPGGGAGVTGQLGTEGPDGGVGTGSGGESIGGGGGKEIGTCGVLDARLMNWELKNGRACAGRPAMGGAAVDETGGGDGFADDRWGGGCGGSASTALMAPPQTVVMTACGRRCQAAAEPCHFTQRHSRRFHTCMRAKRYKNCLMET